MRTLAGILLAAGLLLSVSGVVQCFPGVQERAWKREVQRLSADGRPSEILSHVQTEFQQVRESRIQSAQACFLIASLVFYLGWIARTRAQARPVEPHPQDFAQGFRRIRSKNTPIDHSPGETAPAAAPTVRTCSFRRHRTKSECAGWSPTQTGNTFRASRREGGQQNGRMNRYFWCIGTDSFPTLDSPGLADFPLTSDTGALCLV
jgi:hypothetical protein